MPRPTDHTVSRAWPPPHMRRPALGAKIEPGTSANLRWVVVQAEACPQSTITITNPRLTFEVDGRQAEYTWG